MSVNESYVFSPKAVRIDLRSFVDAYNFFLCAKNMEKGTKSRENDRPFPPRCIRTTNARNIDDEGINSLENKAFQLSLR